MYIYMFINIEYIKTNFKLFKGRNLNFLFVKNCMFTQKFKI